MNHRSLKRATSTKSHPQWVENELGDELSRTRGLGIELRARPEFAGLPRLAATHWSHEEQTLTTPPNHRPFLHKGRNGRSPEIH